jgi:hypothetical protein
MAGSELDPTGQVVPSSKLFNLDALRQNIWNAAIT